MKVKGVAHLAFLTSDMEASLHFYCDILGFRKKFVLNRENGNPWIVYLEMSPGQFFELFYNDANLPTPQRDFFTEAPNVGYQHVSLEVEDIHALEAHLKDNGIRIVHPSSLGLDGTWQLWVYDPDGNPIEFHEYTEDSLQLK